jgi:hypothetical protein
MNALSRGSLNDAENKYFLDWCIWGVTFYCPLSKSSPLSKRNPPSLINVPNLHQILIGNHLTGWLSGGVGNIKGWGQKVKIMFFRHCVSRHCSFAPDLISNVVCMYVHMWVVCDSKYFSRLQEKNCLIRVWILILLASSSINFSEPAKTSWPQTEI